VSWDAGKTIVGYGEIGLSCVVGSEIGGVFEEIEIGVVYDIGYCQRDCHC